MTVAELAQAIRDHGFIAFDDETRVRCAEKKVPGGVGGIAFGVIDRGDHWLICLYSAREYKCSRSQDILGICLDLFSGVYVPSGKIPSVLPPSFLANYDIEPAN